MMQTWKQLNGWGQNSYLVANNKFNIVLSDHIIAGQIAKLLNENNRLSIAHNTNSILRSPVQYFIELSGQTILGCVGLLCEPTMDKIVHISVSKNNRKQGIAKRLLRYAINNSSKDIIYMHIREDNIESKNLSIKMGFNAIAYIPKFNYNILTFCLFRRKNVGWI